jgi:cytochrome c-type biogenesis protein CcmH/NrfG
MALVRLARYAEARDRLIEAVTVDPDQPVFRQALARILSAAPDDRVRDGERAWKLVEGLSKEQTHPGAFETLAMVLAELGHFDLAIDWQRLAMSTAARAGRTDVAQKMAINLARYHQRQPCRAPWRDDDPDHRPGPQVNPSLLDPDPAARK